MNASKPSILIYRNCGGTITFSVGMDPIDSSVSFGFVMTENDAKSLYKGLERKVGVDKKSQATIIQMVDDETKAFMDCSHA